MLTYQYSCSDCSGNKTKNDDWTDVNEAKDGYSRMTGDYLFYIKSRMSNKPKNPKCSRCKNTNTAQSFEYNIECWVRGDGIVKDTAGARRDMNKHTLMTNDPYSHMRQSGEVDDIINKCENGGKDLQKIKKRRIEHLNKNRKKRQRIKLSKNQYNMLLKINEYELVGGCPYNELNKFNDVNKIISSLIPDYICESKNKFRLMARGRSYIDECLSKDIK